MKGIGDGGSSWGSADRAIAFSDLFMQITNTCLDHKIYYMSKYVCTRHLDLTNCSVGRLWLDLSRICD